MYSPLPGRKANRLAVNKPALENAVNGSGIQVTLSDRASHTRPLARFVQLREAISTHSDSDGMGSIPASPNAPNVPLLLCQGRFDEASLPERSSCSTPTFNRQVALAECIAA